MPPLAGSCSGRTRLPAVTHVEYAPDMIVTIELENFLSYRRATLKFGRLVALVGPNASGKSNAVAALKLLRDIPVFGLPTALARRGGYDQLRHRSEGRPYDPAVSLHFRVDDASKISAYELRLRSIAGGRYEVKREHGLVYSPDGEFSFLHENGRVTIRSSFYGREIVDGETESPSVVEVAETERTWDGPVPEGQSAVAVASTYFGLYELWNVLRGLQIVEINPSRVRDLQEPGPGVELEPDGSNTSSVFEELTPDRRQEVVDYLSAVVPGIVGIEPRHISNRLTLLFVQEVEGKRRQFYANQMSDGTLRAFGIILALVQERTPQLTVIEEPETAVHLGALRTLVELLRDHSNEVQVLLTTHSADIIDALDVKELRVVSSAGGASTLAPVAKHTIETIRTTLVTPGELLRADALDAAPQ